MIGNMIGLAATIEPKSGLGNVLAMIGGLVAITLAVFVWAAFFRKPPRRKHSHHRHHRNSSNTPPPERKEAEHSEHKHSRFRRHRRHKKKRHLNPTLAKTGGLPAVRSDGPGTPGSVH